MLRARASHLRALAICTRATTRTDAVARGVGSIPSFVSLLFSYYRGGRIAGVVNNIRGTSVPKRRGTGI